MGFNVNWFLGVLAFELWLAPYVLMFWPEISTVWRERRMERMLDRLALDYQRNPFATHPLRG